MKILILYHSSNQVVLMNSMCDNINKVGLYADLFDTSLLTFYSPYGHKKPFFVWLYRILLKLPHVGDYIQQFFFKLIIFLCEDYDIIDIQSLFKPMYSYIVPELKKRGKKIKVHIWGSDFYQSNPERENWQIKVYDKADIIQIATEQMKCDFIRKFPSYSFKIRTGVFGNQQLDYLADFKKRPEKIELSFLHKEYQGKLIVTCGYNARIQHQHIKMIEALNCLPLDIQDNLLVVFPMTYMRNIDYIKSVEQKLENVNFKYTIIHYYLTELQLMSLRLKTDIFINIIESDALSSSTQEHLFCGNVVIVGDWLPYSIFEDNGLFYIKTSLQQLSKSISYAITNYKVLKEKCTNNPELLYRLTSWNNAISNFQSIYEEIALL